MQKNKLDTYVKSPTTTGSPCKIDTPALIPDTQKLIPCLDNRDSEESEALRVLSRLIEAIENEGDADFSLGVADALLTAIDGITTERVSTANINTQLDTRETPLETLTLNLSNGISEVETGSTKTAAIKLQAQETVHEEVLKATAEVSNLPKLSDDI